MPTKILFDSDRADSLTATASRGVEPDTAAKAAACVRRHLGDQAGDVLRALGLVEGRRA